MAGPIPQDIKKIVVFLFVERPAAGIVPNGTGFFVGVPDPKDKTRSFVYLVTARHVISQTPFGALYPRLTFASRSAPGVPKASSCRSQSVGPTGRCSSILTQQST